jgi:hypothetical protein
LYLEVLQGPPYCPKLYLHKDTTLKALSFPVIERLSIAGTPVPNSLQLPPKSQNRDLDAKPDNSQSIAPATVSCSGKV